MEQGMLAEQLEQDYQLKNLLLAYPNDWFIEPRTLDKAKVSLPSLLNFYKSEGTQDLAPVPIQEIIKETLKDVYTIPLFSKTFCDLLVDEMKSLESFYGFEPNPGEDKLRQIPEITFQDNCPEIYQSLFQTIYTIGNPILLCPSVNNIMLFPFSEFNNKLTLVTIASPKSVPPVFFTPMLSITYLTSSKSLVNSLSIKVVPANVTTPTLLSLLISLKNSLAEFFATSILFGVKSLTNMLLDVSIAKTKSKSLPIPEYHNVTPETENITNKNMNILTNNNPALYDNI